jgi:hypothetical protein
MRTRCRGFPHRGKALSRGRRALPAADRRRRALRPPRRGGLAEVAALPLCALSPDMHNRRLLDDALAAAGAEPRSVLETDTVAAIYAHVATGRWPGLVAQPWVTIFGPPAGTRAIPLADPSPGPAVGLVAPLPVPMLASALFDAVRRADLGAELARVGTCRPPGAPETISSTGFARQGVAGRSPRPAFGRSARARRASSHWPAPVRLRTACLHFARRAFTSHSVRSMRSDNTACEVGDSAAMRGGVRRMGGGQVSGSGDMWAADAALRGPPWPRCRPGTRRRSCSAQAGTP